LYTDLPARGLGGKRCRAMFTFAAIYRKSKPNGRRRETEKEFPGVLSEVLGEVSGHDAGRTGGKKRATQAHSCGTGELWCVEEKKRKGTRRQHPSKNKKSGKIIRKGQTPRAAIGL